MKKLDDSDRHYEITKKAVVIGFLAYILVVMFRHLISEVW
jgi:hypothetical protein